MEMNKIIRRGSEVEMHFRLSIENGLVIEDTHEDEPYVFTVGDGSLVYGLEQALDGIAENSIEKIVLEPEQAFGFSDPENVMPMARTEFPEEMDLKKGIVIGFSSPSGEEVPGTVTELTDESVTIDFNHPLAGQTVIFDVEILSVKNSALN
jgi:FKBP-type peptidyl-prolyl cis-trans isomerase SlpA